MKNIVAATLLSISPLCALAGYNTVMVDSNRSIVYPTLAFSNVSATKFTLHDQTITEWTGCVVTNTLVSSNWSIWPATTNIDIGGYNISEATAVYATNIAAENINATNITAINFTAASLTSDVTVANSGTFDVLVATTNSFSFSTIVTAAISYVQSPNGIIIFKD